MTVMKHLMFISFLVVISCRASEFSIDEAVKEIMSAPDWTRMDENGINVEGQKIVGILNKYANLPARSARELVCRLIDSGEEFDLSVAGKVYLYNRIYCKVPKTVNRRDWRFFGGWHGVAIIDEEINALFPLVRKDDGTLELKCVFGGYTGPLYRGLDEFDFFLRRFGHRASFDKVAVDNPIGSVAPGAGKKE